MPDVTLAGTARRSPATPAAPPGVPAHPAGGAEAALRTQVSRQLAHWTMAVATLDQPENFAAPAAWKALEGYLDLALRRELQKVVDRLRGEIAVIRIRLATARTTADLQAVRQSLVTFRQSFERAETVLDFYGDAVNSRTNPRLGALLRACDFLAERSMAAILPHFGLKPPPVLTYIDKGMGASILRHGLRLWDPNSLSPAAAIKITRHNLYRPTSLIHEAGHQVAFMLGWNGELAAALSRTLHRQDGETAQAWHGWASEVAADTYAFAHTGYAAVAALHDVLAADPVTVFRMLPGDPHPVAFARILLGTAMCRSWFGAGPWDDLEAAWVAAYPPDLAPAGVRDLLVRSARLVPAIADVCLRAPMRAFGGRPLAAVVDPSRVHPRALRSLAHQAGPALHTSPHWLRSESLRLLAWSGYRAATEPERAGAIADEFESWMLRLGGGVHGG